MSESKRSHRHHGEQVPNSDHQGHPPYWKRAHRDWKFWVALSLMLAAMIIYVISETLAWRPRNQAQQSQSGVVRK